MTAEIDAVLGSVPFLRGGSSAARAELARMAVAHDYPKGNLLFYHGEPSTALYLVVSGRAKLSLFSEEGREVVLTVIRPGGIVGLDGALALPTHFGTCTTLMQSRLARISHNAFVEWLHGNPAVEEALLTELSRRLRAAYEKIGEQALLPVKKRLLMTLIDIARAEGVPGKAGEISFVRPTHQELAELVGSTRVVVTRLLKELIREQQALAAQGNVIRIYPDDLVLDEGLVEPAGADVT